MTQLHDWLWRDGRFLGVAWSAWKLVGWTGLAVFSTRFLVQWYATEKQKQVTVPALFWWLSLVGTLLLLSYAIHERDMVFIFAYAVSWVPYIRNLIIHHRHERSRPICPACGVRAPSAARFCGQCGERFENALVAEAN